MAVTPRQLTGLDPIKLSPLVGLADAPTLAPAAVTADGFVANTGPSAAERQAAAAEAAKKAANQASRDATQKGIDSLATELNIGYGNIDAERGSIASRYDREAGQNENDYTENTVTNNNNLLKNKQGALVAGAQGNRGLMSVLSSIGAANGDGLRLAGRAVTQAANEDIAGAADTFTTNQGAQDKAIGRFREDDKNRRDDLEVQTRNRKTALEGQIESKRQGFLQKMADLFGDIGDGANAAKYLGMAGDLNEGIARKTAVAAAPLAARDASFTPGQMSEYLAGAGDMTVTTQGAPDGSGMPSIFTTRRKDERRTATV